MGYLQIGRIVIGGAALALLIGCEQRTWTASEIREIAGEVEPYVGGNTQLTMDLESRIIDLERKVEMQERIIESLGKASDENVRVDNDNVRIYNKFKNVTNEHIAMIEQRLGM